VPLHGVLVRENHVAHLALDVLGEALVDPGDVLVQVVVGREELAADGTLKVTLGRDALLSQVGELVFFQSLFVY
jgi:hypothetical protein